VECVFGILKERWCCLQQGFKYRDIKQCQEIFVTCCVLHNMMLDKMTKNDANSLILSDKIKIDIEVMHGDIA
jgi:hypothetical protein